MCSTARRRGAAALPLLALLCACQDQQARTQNAELERRVTALEARVQRLEGRGAEAGPSPAGAAAVTARASAQNCAAELSRALEGFRRVSLEQRYPTERELNLPPACAGERLSWEKRTAQAYAFTVRGTGGEVLARQSGP